MGENMPEDSIKKLLDDTIRIQTFEETLFTVPAPWREEEAP